jgi:hypothetical protein
MAVADHIYAAGDQALAAWNGQRHRMQDLPGACRRSFKGIVDDKLDVVEHPLSQILGVDIVGQMPIAWLSVTRPS